MSYLNLIPVEQLVKEINVENSTPEQIIAEAKKHFDSSKTIINSIHSSLNTKTEDTIRLLRFNISSLILMAKYKEGMKICLRYEGFIPIFELEK